MILNEDYFKDIEITDDIISSDDKLNHNTDDYANPEEYYNAMSSKYSHYIVLDTETDNVLTDSELWTNKIPRMLKKLFYMFDSYGMEYSTPVVTGSDYFPQEHIYIENVLKGCKFFDFYGYKLITKYDTLEDLVDDLELSVLLFFNPPKTLSYTAACKFIGNMAKTLWKNKNYDTFIDSIYVHNIMTDVEFEMYNPYTYDNSVINKTSIQHIVNMINLFFPEKKYNDIEEELIKDKQLLLKLYKCFPNY